MSRIAPAVAPPLPAKGLVIELVENNGNWSPPKGVTTVLMELCGAGQGGGANTSNGAGYGGQSGDLVNRIIADVTEATVFQVVCGVGGTQVAQTNGSGYGNPGGSTSVTVKGVTHSALGGGATGNRRGTSGAYNQGSVAVPSPPSYSILLGSQSPGFGTAPRPGAGGCSPIGLGATGDTVAGLGCGGLGVSTVMDKAVGGKGYVLFGYFLP